MKGRELRVLIVDDEELVRINLVALLEDEGIHVRSASSGEAALEIMKDESFDLGIIDMRLTGMDGNTMICRAHEMNGGMKFIIHTGSTNYALPKTLLDMGITNSQVIRKPLTDVNILINEIRKLMGTGREGD